MKVKKYIENILIQIPKGKTGKINQITITEITKIESYLKNKKNLTSLCLSV